MKVGSFKISGTEYGIEIDNVVCKNKSSKYHNPTQRIIVSDEYEGIKLNYDNVERKVIRCFLEIVTVYEMEYRELKGNDKYVLPFSSLLYQVMNTLTSKVGQWDGDLKIGGVNWSVIVNNELAEEEGFYGRCDAESKIIYLCTESNDKTLYNDEYIQRTLWHEIVHAINYEIGYNCTKYNSEKFVNVLANYIYQMVNTLEIKYPEE